jgi:phosphorylase kinase alpha/beta subunit
MVVAALEAINGINLFGSRGGASSVIHVLPDEIARNFTTLHSALPRESPSKEIDAALLSVISYPAFAVTDPDLIERTRKDIVKKLGGRYGCKRFLRDGHQTVLEDHNRLHYEAHELKIFENVESEWPLFFTYLILDGLFRNDVNQVEHYSKLLEPILINADTIEKYQINSDENEGHDRYSIRLVPELYIVPKESIDAEREQPGSQDRVPNQNVPLVWAQSLYILGNLIRDGLLSPADIDPLGRRLNPVRSRLHIDTVIQIVLLSENDDLQAKLLMYGLETHTVQDVAPITISNPSCLRDAYTFLGKNVKLGLSGRPDRPMGTLSTSKIYRCQGQLYAFLPHFMNREEFYLVSDNDYLVSLFEQEISSVRNHWMQTGRPTMVVMLNKQMLGNIDRVDTEKGIYDSGKRNLLNFLISIKSSGICHGTRVRVGRLSEMINTACVETLDFLVNSGSESSEDWDSILKGKQQKSGMEKLKFSETTYFARNRSLSTRSRTIRTEQDLPLKSPLAKSLGYAPDMEDLSLLDDLNLQEEPDQVEIAGVSKKSSPTQEFLPIVSLTLRQPLQTTQAIELLYKSNSLSDQIDLLHYLYSCHGLDYVVPKLASINTLLEEVYWKAMQVKQWSTVRKAAGILKKTVNSLTSNLSDLLVRQKPVTIGVRPKEFFIDTPMNPSALAQIIFNNWYLFLM